MTSQWVMMLLGMPHYGTTIGDDVAMDTHCDVTMGNVHIIYHGMQWIMTLPCITTPNYDIAVSTSKLRQTCEISIHKNNSHDRHRVITHSLVLVIIICLVGRCTI